MCLSRPEFEREVRRRLKEGAVQIVPPVRLTQHVGQRARERGFTDIEIRKILERGRSCEDPRPADPGYTGWVTRYLWTSPEGKPAELMVGLPDDGRLVVAITIMRGKK